MHSNRLFFGVGVITGISLMCPVVAAPSVKNFGNATSSSVYGNAGRQKMYVQPSAANNRAGSLRVSGSATKPVTKVASATRDTSVALQDTGSVDSVRSSGLRGNLVKGVSSKLSSNYASHSGSGSGTVSGLEQRIADMESQLSAKQDVLESGDGVNIENNTISLSQDIVDLPETVDGMRQEIDDLSQQISSAVLPENYYTIGETQTYLQQNYYNKQYIDQSLSSIDFMNYFDGDMLANKTYVFKTDANGDGKWRELDVQKDWDPGF